MRGHRTRKDSADLFAILSDERDKRRVRAKWVAKGCEILSLAVSPHEEIEALSLLAEALHSRDDGAHVRSLGVVDDVDALRGKDEFHTVRLALVAANPVERRALAAARGPHQSKRRENIERVVAAAKKKIRFREKRHEAPLLPAHELVAEQTVIAVALGSIFAERQVARTHKTWYRVVSARKHTHARRAENALLGRAIPRHRAVPVDVVFCNVEKRCDVKRK